MVDSRAPNTSNHTYTTGEREGGWSIPSSVVVPRSRRT